MVSGGTGRSAGVLVGPHRLRSASIPPVGAKVRNPPLNAASRGPHHSPCAEPGTARHHPVVNGVDCGGESSRQIPTFLVVNHGKSRGLSEKSRHGVGIWDKCAAPDKREVGGGASHRALQRGVRYEGV